MNAWNRMTQYWSQRPPREQALLRLAAAVVVGATVWAFGLAPALKTVREAEAAHARADAQLQQIEAMAAKARTLQSQARLSPSQARTALEASVQSTLGARAQTSVSGDRVTVTLSGVSGEALARWLQQLRSGASARPLEAKLQRNAQGAWDGRLVLQLSGAGA
ncbi:MAG: type II secretion system protein M [Betaproteobacteria bacterium]|jgi:general secretion pathway protein M|nr:type II secretion system protein M [Betaproteobacteria bacterium]